MVEVLVIAPVPIAAGFRLAGVGVLPARNAEEVLARIEEARSHGGIKLVFAPEHFLADFAPQEYGRLLHSEDPYFVSIPMDPQATDDDRHDFEARLGRILGCRISLSEQISGGGGSARP